MATKTRKPVKKTKATTAVAKTARKVARPKPSRSRSDALARTGDTSLAHLYDMSASLVNESALEAEDIASKVKMVTNCTRTALSVFNAQMRLIAMQTKSDAKKNDVLSIAM